MAKTFRLTMAQALTRFMSRQFIEHEGRKQSFFAGVWAIFGHGNVAALGEALFQAREDLPTFRGQNEQSMAHSAIAFAKASRRRRVMAATSSIGPGALNMVTAAGVAHVNRIPVLLLPGDVFASRRPDPVLQQVEDFGDGTVSANDCFRPVSRYFDRITRPEQIIPALNRAMSLFTDPAETGPVTLALCQDVQAEAFDYPESFFEERLWHIRRPRPDQGEMQAALEVLKAAKKPVIIAGGGVLYSEAEAKLKAFAKTRGIPVAETQAGKSSLPFSEELNMGAIGVTGTEAANRLCAEADVVLAIGTRLQDFTTGSWALFQGEGKKLIGLNVQAFDASKHRSLPLLADARTGLDELDAALGGWKAPSAWTDNAKAGREVWLAAAEKFTAADNQQRPSDAQVIGAVQRALGREITVVGAAGGLPGELHKLWQAEGALSYHMEYGFSCMGYEIAGGLGVKLARPGHEVLVMLGDGSYTMANSEIISAVMLGLKLTILLLDNRGFGCINRLQHACGGERFNNLYDFNTRQSLPPHIDFVSHAASLGAQAIKVQSLAELEEALQQARAAAGPVVVVIDTDPMKSTEAGGHWWDVAVPEVSVRPEVKAARDDYVKALQQQHIGD